VALTKLIRNNCTARATWYKRRPYAHVLAIGKNLWFKDLRLIWKSL